MDKQAEIGLTGTELIAAKAQTHLDEVIAAEDRNVNAAKIHADEASGQGEIAEAEARRLLAGAESTAKLNETKAQQEVELARAKSGAGTTGTTSAPVNNFTIYITGEGMNEQELTQALDWKIKTGGLSIAQPNPIRTAA